MGRGVPDKETFFLANNPPIPLIVNYQGFKMNELGNASVSFRFICQIVDKDFYPVRGVFPVRVLPVQFIGEVANDMKVDHAQDDQ